MRSARRPGANAVAPLLALAALGAMVAVVLIGEHLVPRSERDPAMTWIARALLVLAVAWTVIGVIASRTRLVRRPGAAAARATWVAATTPWRAAESTLGILSLDRWLLVLVPAALLAGIVTIQAASLSWGVLAFAVAGWAVFVVGAHVVTRRWSPWPLIAAVGGVVVLWCILTLAVLSWGSARGGFVFWIDPIWRIAYLAASVVLVVWAVVAAVLAGASRRGAASRARARHSASAR